MVGVTMKAIVYRNTKTTLPGWIPSLHNSNPRGVAYKIEGHFVHMYGGGDGLCRAIRRRSAVWILRKRDRELRRGRGLHRDRQFDAS